MVSYAKNILLLLMLSCSMLLSAAQFTPYLPTDVDENEIQSVNSVLQNFNHSDASGLVEDASYYDYMDRAQDSYIDETTTSGTGTYVCAYCMEKENSGGDYFSCLDDIYHMGVVPVKEGETVVRYEFPYCPYDDCPIHHTLGYAAKSDGSISDVVGVALGDDPESMKPILPNGEPFIMLLFALAYMCYKHYKAKREEC